MSSTLDQYMAAFANFMETGQTGTLDQYCDPDAQMDYFRIYRNGYMRSTVDAVTSNYPATQALLGADYFRNLAKLFVLEFPPTKGSLSGYGEEFADFLLQTEISRSLPYLHDVAEIDRAWLHVYFAPNDSPASPVEITRLLENDVETGTERIRLCDATAILSLNFPVLDIWRELKENGSLGQSTRLEKELQYVLIWRNDSQVLVRKLPLPEFIVLSGIKDGTSMEQSAEQALNLDATFELDIFFSSLISEGLLKVKEIQSTE